MAATTTLLGLVTPTQGTLSGTWGDTVNYGISDYVDIAIAGTLSFAGDGAITLANTTGSASGNGITSTTAQYMVIRITGTLTTPKIITAPSYSKLYMVDNAATGSTVTFKAAGQTGVSVAVGEKCFVYYNGTDYVKVASSVVVATANIPQSTRTSNTILASSDASTLVVITSGTFTQTFTAAATLGSGWFCYIQNLGTGDITLDPNGSETIDGLTSYIMYGGETRLVQCTGTAFTSVVLSPFYRAFTSTENFTKPPGYSYFTGLVWGAGGGGGKSGSSDGGGGGGGTCVPLNLLASAVSASTTVTIGAGGTGATADPSQGAAGGNTTFGSLVTAYGGGGGGGDAAGVGGGSGGGALGAGGVGTTGTVVGGIPSISGQANNTGFGGGGTSAGTAGGISVYGGGGGGAGDSAGLGGASVYGGGGGGGSSGVGSRAGGTSVFGGAGGLGNMNTPVAGTAPAGGGGGARNVNGAAGARGELRIWGVA